MAQIIPISVASDRRQVTVEQAWAAYLRAEARAKTTCRIEDGIAAGKAWAAWLELFARRA